MKTRTMILADLFATLRSVLDIEQAAVLLWAIRRAAEQEGDLGVSDSAGRAMAALECVLLADAYLDQLIAVARLYADEAHDATEHMLAALAPRAVAS